jgi:hypothetical protein
MRFTRVHAVFGTIALAGAVLVGAVLVLDTQGGAQPSRSAADQAVPADSASDSAMATPSAVVSTVASPSPTPSKSPKPKPKPSPSRKKVTIPGPPPPPPVKPAPLPSGEKCPYYEGTNAPKPEVESALEAAAAKRFWTVSSVVLPNNLIKAVAKQESGWQSAIMACDGGIGTMQVMPNTATWMNQRFGTSYDVKTLSGNTMIGSAYLQWSIKYFGDTYFDGDYTLDAAACAQDPAVPDYQEPCLLNAVIAAYNYGYGAVDDEVNGKIVIPNPSYVRPVRALMLTY